MTPEHTRPRPLRSKGLWASRRARHTHEVTRTARLQMMLQALMLTRHRSSPQQTGSSRHGSICPPTHARQVSERLSTRRMRGSEIGEGVVRWPRVLSARGQDTSRQGLCVCVRVCVCVLEREEGKGRCDVRSGEDETTAAGDEEEGQRVAEIGGEARARN
eukprot:2745321-Rhodomonas_salina.1